MKKLVLIMVFVLLMALFIAFNYLLWDRESKINELKSLEYDNASKSSSINALNRDIKSLENENNQLLTDISRLEKEKDQLSQNNQQLESEKASSNQDIKHKIEIINVLKKNIDITIFEAPIRKWAEAVDSGNYNEAYQLEYKKAGLQVKQESLEEYTNILKSNVKSMKVKEISREPEEGNADGDIILKAVLDVKAPDNAAPATVRFTDGLNEVRIKLDYDISVNEFFITEITR